MKLVKALFVLALAVLIAAPAYAETQNVKVSGSLDAYAFHRANYDLNKDGGSSTGGVAGLGARTNTGNDSEADDYFMSTTQVEISADLTDNVSTVINLLNERDWDAALQTQGADASTDIGVDLAYVQMKEIFYSPLTLTIGRQDIWFGRGFIIGNNSHNWDVEGNIVANEYSASTAFDAVRATLDFNPWTLDFVYSKISEGTSAAVTAVGNTLNQENDIDLYIVNVNYKFAEYNAVAEGYFVSEWDRGTNQGGAGVGDDKSNDTETIGARVQFDPISQITLGGELAYQFGNYGVDTSNLERDRSAWAVNVFGTYRWDYTWKPEVTLEYVHFSGEGDLVATSTADYEAWNGLYRGKFWTAYADFREFVYATDDGVDQPATQNQQFIQVKGSLKPLEDLLLEGSFTYLWLAEDIHTPTVALTDATKDEAIGWEIDLQAVYDYTEDVSFGVLAAWFVPGDFYSSPNDETAVDLVGSVKVTF